ncbi:MAG: hypothetical protein FWE57_08710 [Chitinispirillia bacterium]|nr:hypothetical protein [Chitinispirillia bacterium]
MGKFTKRLGTGLAAVLALSFGASANILIDDFRSGTNENRMGQYWYYYTNLGTKGGPGNTQLNEWNMGRSVRRNYATCVEDRWETIMHLREDQFISQRGLQDFEMVFEPSSRAPRPGGRSVNAMMAFQMPGGPDTPGYVCNPGVGMGTNLTQDPEDGVQQPIGAPFATVTHINFYARVSHADMPVRFKVETAEQLRNVPEATVNTPDTYATSKKLSDGAYAAKLSFNAADTWQRFSIAVTGACNLTELQLEGDGTLEARRGACVGDLQRAPFEVYGAQSWHGPTHAPGLAQVNYTYSVTDAVKIAWFVQGEDWTTEPGVTAYLFIDSVWTTGGEFNLPGECPNCVTSLTVPTNAWKLSDFESIVFEPSDGSDGFLSQNRLGGPWYAYTDGKDAKADSSKITWGLWYDPFYLVVPPVGPNAVRCNPENPPAGVTCVQGGAGLNVEGVTVGTALADSATVVTAAMFGEFGDLGAGNKAGHNNSGGAAIAFTTGPGWKEMQGSSEVTIQGFVGIGTKLTEFENQRFNATAGAPGGGGAISGIWFMYNTNFGDRDRMLTVSVVDENAYANGEGNADATYAAKIPTTEGEWRAAHIPFSVLAVPMWSTWTQPLDLTKLVEVQFRFDGPAGVEGSIAIDNVYFVDASTSVRRTNAARAKASAPALRASYSRGSVNVNWNAPAQISSGRVSLVNARGVVVASQSINASGANVAARLTTRGSMPTGMYFVRIDARDVNGKRIVQQVPMSIVK